VKFHQAIPWFWLLALLASGAVVTQLLTRVDPLLLEAPSTELLTHNGRAAILWLGDLPVPGAAEKSNTAAHDRLLDLERFREILDADLVVANAGADVRPQQDGTRSAALDLRTLHLLGGRPVALGLANTAMLDGETPAVAAALAQARAVGLMTFGAGTMFVETKPSSFEPRPADCRRPLTACWQPEAPFMVRTPVGVVGILAFAEDFELKSRATRDTAGFTLLQLGVLRGVQSARRAGADWVVAYVHWGQNYQQIDERQRSWARLFARAGYDLVIGHHPDSPHPIEFIDGMPMVYSLGQAYLADEPQSTRAGKRYSVVLTSELGEHGPELLRLRCFLAGDRHGERPPLLCPEQEADSVLRSLHSDIRMEEGTGVLPWRGRSPGGRSNEK
jgi:hypothetical protein